MAGVLYLYRLFVYHSKNGKTSQDNHKLLSTMEKKLYYFITLPAMLVSWACGLSLLYLNPGLMSGKWLHIKLLCVILLTLFTLWAPSHMRKFQRDRHSCWDHRIFIMFNEFPTILMMVIIAMIVFRPF